MVFFCFKQKSAYEVRISDWSSDVCSSVFIARSISDEAISSYRQGATIAGDCFAPLAKTKCLDSPPNDIHVSRKGPPIGRRGERNMDRFDIIVIGGGSDGREASGRVAEDGTRGGGLAEGGGAGGKRGVE